MGDEHQRHPSLSLKVFKEFQDLRLKRHIQGRGGLIRNQHIGLAHQGHGNHDTLQLSPRKLKGILLKAPGGLTQTHTLKPLNAARFGLRGRNVLVTPQRLEHLIPDSHHRVQTARGLLKNDGDAPTPKGLHLPL